MGARSEVLIRINGDAASFNNELKKVDKETKDLSAGLAKTAAASTAGFAVLTAAIGVSVNAYRESYKVEQETAAVIKATGGAAGVTAEQVAKLGTSLQRVTNYGDETVKSAENIILRFKNVKENIFPQVTELSLDMAEKFGSVSAAAEFLGKVLNNPARGMTQLRKEGIILSEEQKKTIAAMLETGNVAGAQAILIGKLTQAYGGHARAVADPFIQLKEAIGDDVEVIGSVFTPIAVKMANALKQVAIYLSETNPEVLKIGAYAAGAAAVILGLTAAVTGGMFIFLKVTAVYAAYSASAGVAAVATGALTTAFTALGGAVTFLCATPLGLLITALAAIGTWIAFNLDKVKAFFAGINAVAQTVKDNWDGLFGSSSESASKGGKSAADAYWAAYNQSLAEQKANAEPEVAGAPDFSARNEALQAQSDYEVEQVAGNNKKKLDLEQQLSDQLFALHEEQAQLDLNREAFMATERERIAAEEQKTRLRDEAQYGKAMADVKAFYRTREVSDTTELFGTLATLTQSKNKTLFDIGKVAAIANATIYISEGIAKAIAQGGFLGLAMGAAVAAAGAVQIANITSTQLQAAKGYSGSGSAFGESFVSTFTPREIVVPERFSEGIKSGEYSLTSAKDQQNAQGTVAVVQVELVGEAAEFITVRQIQNKRLNIGNG